MIVFYPAFHCIKFRLIQQNVISSHVHTYWSFKYLIMISDFLMSFTCRWYVLVDVNAVTVVYMSYWYSIRNTYFMPRWSTTCIWNWSWILYVSVCIMLTIFNSARDREKIVCRLPFPLIRQKADTKLEPKMKYLS